MSVEHSVIEQINDSIYETIRSLGLLSRKDLVEIKNKYSTSYTEELSNGHITSNASMVLASIIKDSPRKIAEKIKEGILQLECIDKVEIAGPGFLNVFLKRDSFASTIIKIIDLGNKFGKKQSSNPKKIQIEFVSANPTGPLHVGHGRGAAYGDALARILEAYGEEVEKEYYVNDAGRQIDILTVSIFLRAFSKVFRNFFPQNGYKGAYILEVSDYFKKNYGEDETPDFCLRENLSSDPEIQLDEVIEDISLSYPKIWHTLKTFSLKKVLKIIEEDLKKFNVVFDKWFFESSIGTMSDKKSDIYEAIKSLDKKKLVFNKEGAIWFKTTLHNDDKDRVLIRENGRPTYLASDVAYHKNKLDRGFDKIINIWGADHHGYIKRIEASIEGVGYSKDKMQVQLVQFANLFKDKKKIKMSTRSGEFYCLSDLIDEIGVDAARFFYLSKQADQHLDFDIDLAKSDSKENIFYYIQYAHARIYSLEEKASLSSIILEKDLTAIISGSYKKCDDLIHQLSKFPFVIERSAKMMQPHQIIFYLKDLSQLFHSFYNDNHVLTENKENLSSIILCLRSIREVIASGLGLLGIKAIKKM